MRLWFRRPHEGWIGQLVVGASPGVAIPTGFPGRNQGWSGRTGNGRPHFNASRRLFWTSTCYWLSFDQLYQILSGKGGQNNGWRKNHKVHEEQSSIHCASLAYGQLSKSKFMDDGKRVHPISIVPNLDCFVRHWISLNVSNVRPFRNSLHLLPKQFVMQDMLWSCWEILRPIVRLSKVITGHWGKGLKPWVAGA